jgi:hypothetical protein
MSNGAEFRGIEVGEGVDQNYHFSIFGGERGKGEIGRTPF